MILAMGKFGGREMNYHSDLDVIFLYEADGHTQHRQRGRRDTTTTNQHFFSELASGSSRLSRNSDPLAGCTNSMRACGPPARAARWPSRSPNSRATSPRARATLGAAGVVQGAADLWLAPCGRPRWRPCARRCCASPGGRNSPRKFGTCGSGWKQTASPQNLKRGPGGTVDIEFLVQMLQLQHAAEKPEVLVPGTLDAISALRCRLSDADDAEYLRARTDSCAASKPGCG